MPALVIKSFPEDLHEKLRQIAANHRRSVTQETIHLIEKAIASEEKAAQDSNAAGSKWANRKLSPEYVAMLESGAFSGGTDSTAALSDERNSR
jgi:plasmid stability protein